MMQKLFLKVENLSVKVDSIEEKLHQQGEQFAFSVSSEHDFFLTLFLTLWDLVILNLQGNTNVHLIAIQILTVNGAKFVKMEFALKMLMFTGNVKEYLKTLVSHAKDTLNMVVSGWK